MAGALEIQEVQIDLMEELAHGIAPERQGLRRLSGRGQCDCDRRGSGIEIAQSKPEILFRFEIISPGT
jgi:hypothetical protein